MKNNHISTSENSINDFNKFLLLILAIVSLIIIFYDGNNLFLMLYSIVELIYIVIAFTMIIIAFNTCKINKDSRIVFLSIAYGFIACFNLIHLFLYKETGTFAQAKIFNLSIQVSLITQYIESTSMLIALAFPRIKFSTRKVFMSYFIITVTIILLIFKFNSFPDCYIKGLGITRFKVISEYVTLIIKLFSIFLIIRDKNNKTSRNSRLILSSLITVIISKIFINSFMSTSHLYVFIGHISKLVSIYLIYIALVESSIREPHNHLKKKFRQLNDRNIKLKKKYKYLNKKNISLNKKVILLNQKNKELIGKIDKFYSVSDKRQNTDDRIVLKSEILDTILNDLSEGILVLSNYGRVIYYNKKFLEMWDISSKISSISEKEIFDCIKEELFNFEESLELVEKCWQTFELYTFELQIKDKRKFKVNSSLFVDNDIILGRIFTFIDITELKKDDELQKDVEIQQVRTEEANKYDELKNSFFSTVSHEFRTPLNMILGSIQLMTKMRDDNSDNYNLNMLAKYLNMTKLNCNRLVKLINNIIDINNIESGFMQLNLKKYNIIAIIEDITLSVVKYAEMKGISLIFDTDIEERIIPCDADKIEKIMLNLLSNAVKYTEQGKIEVYIKEENKNIVISVKDTGIGIPLEMQQKVFEKFGQVDTSFTRQKEGSGIGLALVKELTRLHNGNIRLYSEVGKGSEFIIELPISLAAEDICDETIEDKEINIERIDVEFSDIYF